MASSRTTTTAPGRIIFGLMFFTVTFSLVGSEVATSGKQAAVLSKSSTTDAQAASAVLGGPFKILFGGTVAWAALSLLSHAGEPGERFAVGLATVAFITSALVYGKPVWQAINTAVGSAGPGGTPTTPTTPTTGTIQTATALSAVAG